VVAAAADLPFFVYNLPQCTGIEITPVLMRKIQEQVPQLAGLKHSAPSFGNVAEFAGMGLHCLVGDSLLMLPGLTVGAVGCIDGPPNIAPELWVEIWNAYQAGDLKRAEAAQKQASQVTQLVRDFNFHAVCKAVLSERLDIDCGIPRAPGLPLGKEQHRQVLERAAGLGLGKVNIN